MRLWYRTVAAAPALLPGCDSAPERVAIVAHYVPACAPAPDSAPAQLELIALGDFDRSNDSVSILSSDAAQQALGLPQDTRAVELSTLGGRGYWGTGELDARRAIPVLLWPRESACAIGQLAASADSGEWLLGRSSRASRVFCLAGLPDPSGAAPGLQLDLGTAQLTPLESEQRLGAPRRFASLSELGDQLLIAGGIDPGSTRHRSDAELFDPFTGQFAVERRTLAVPRARHAALTLPSGATLLIGGESEGGSALASVELVSSDATRAPRALELLATPRIQPSALLLADGRILVGGGYAWAASATDPQAARQAIGSVEFLSFDLTDGAGNPGPIRLDPPALDRAFVEIAAGSTLAVGGCDPVQRSSECLACGSGSGCISRSVWWIDPQGGAHALEPLPVELAAAQPLLVPAADGSPWLIANGRLARFDPWQARFVAADELLTAPISQRPSPLALGPGLFVWLQQSGETLELFGLHSSQRGAWTQDVAPLLVGSARGLVPHLPPSSSPAQGAASLRYVTATGLQLSGSSAAVSIADTDYASFTLDLTLAAGPAPLLRLAGTAASAGESASFGGLECAWPDFGVPEASPVRLRVQRVGDLVSLLLPDAEGPNEPAPAPCRRPLPERVRVELLGTPLGSTRLTRVEIRRSL
ncbi:MAG TPA: hypothetical protein VFS67_34885 [Polyangiaceae bacterium]|nr:hypothetical protein [Polyangiaceae bacterium]